MVWIVLNDVYKQLKNILALGIVFSVILVFVISAADTFTETVEERRYIDKYVDDDIYYLLLDKIPSKRSDSYGTSALNGYVLKENYDLFQNIFGDDNAGIQVNVGENNDEKYGIVVLLGIYNDILVSGDVPRNRVTIVGSDDLYDTTDGFVHLSSGDYELSREHKITGMYIPQGTYTPAESIKNTVFVCAWDLNDIIDVLPWIERYDIDGSVLLDRMIIKSPTEEENIRLRREIFDKTGYYAQLISCREYYSRDVTDEVKQNAFYLLFYLIAVISFPIVMIVNCFVQIGKNMRSYYLHHMYGASWHLIFSRVFALAMAFFLIPCVSVKIFYENTDMSNVWVLPLCFGLVVSIGLAVVTLKKVKAADSKILTDIQ